MAGDGSAEGAFGGRGGGITGSIAPSVVFHRTACNDEATALYANLAKEYEIPSLKHRADGMVQADGETTTPMLQRRVVKTKQTGERNNKQTSRVDSG